VKVCVYGEAFSALRPKERIWGASFSDMILTLSSFVSYAKATDLCNRFLHRNDDDALCTKTVKDFVERTGLRIDAEYGKTAEAILRANKIDTATGIPDKDSPVARKAKDAEVHTASREKVAEVAGLRIGMRRDMICSQEKHRSSPFRHNFNCTGRKFI